MTGLEVGIDFDRTLGAALALGPPADDAECLGDGREDAWIVGLETQGTFGAVTSFAAQCLVFIFR